ncbi:MAG TPA: hypothetical protein VN495_00695 [Candidatus Paceibacterota bacterium]|nr:hypothetical protein [Candidatus Paceibacterota bacterium]
MKSTLSSIESMECRDAYTFSRHITTLKAEVRMLILPLLAVEDVPPEFRPEVARELTAMAESLALPDRSAFEEVLKLYR